MSLSLEQILAKEDKQIRKVPCPEWGGDCYVKTLSADDLDKWELAVKNKQPNLRALMVALALCTANGEKLNPTNAQTAALGQKAAEPMDRLCETILSMNRLRNSDLEELEKNSETTAQPD